MRVKDTFDFSAAGSAAWADFSETKPMQKIQKQSKNVESIKTDRGDAGLFICKSFAGGRSLSMENQNLSQSDQY